MQAHLPIIVNFWNSILLYKSEYKGSPFDKHVPLDLEKKHFDRWLLLLNTTTNEMFKGEKASLLLQRAHSIGAIFLHKINYLKGKVSSI